MIGYHSILNVFVKPFVAFNHFIKVIKDIWLLSSVESRKCTYNQRYDKWNFNSKHYTQFKTFKKLNISYFIVIFPLHSQSNKSHTLLEYSEEMLQNPHFGASAPSSAGCFDRFLHTVLFPSAPQAQWPH